MQMQMQMQMGEAAAPGLMRSVSHPLFGFKEGDRLRALATSVSFGRFMTEPLDWERWSSFSHNRTLEDVQKYSRPGAVAEKKAFFEAYYKNSAPKPPKTENKSPNFSDTNYNKPPSIGVESVISSKDDVCLPRTTTNLGFSDTGDADDTISSTCQSEQEQTSTGNASSNSGVKPEIASNKDVCLPITVYSEIGEVDGVISSTGQVEREITSTEYTSSPSTSLVSGSSGVKPETSSNKDDVCLPGTTNLSFSEIGDVDGVISSTSQVDVKDDTLINRGVELEMSSKEDVGLPRTNLVFSEIELEKTSTENVSSVENLNHVEKNKKAQMKDKVSTQTKTGLSRVKSSSRKTPPIAEIQHKKAVAAATEKKKSVLQSLHSSIKFPASLNKSLNLKTFIKPKDRPIPQPLTRVSSADGVKKTSQVLPRPEHKRSNPLLSCSLNGSKATVLKSVSINNSEASIASTKKPRSATVFSSFSFKSDERAAKRKEFFQKLEEKGNINKTEKTQLQPKLKEKGNKKLPFPQAKISTRPSNIIQKVPPKLGKKNFIEINKKKLSSSMACLSSKKLVS